MDDLEYEEYMQEKKYWLTDPVLRKHISEDAVPAALDIVNKCNVDPKLFCRVFELLYVQDKDFLETYFATAPAFKELEDRNHYEKIRGDPLVSVSKKDLASYVRDGTLRIKSYGNLIEGKVNFVTSVQERSFIPFTHGIEETESIENRLSEQS